MRSERDETPLVQVVRNHWKGQETDSVLEQRLNLVSGRHTVDGSRLGRAIVDLAGFVGERRTHILRLFGQMVAQVSEESPPLSQIVVDQDRRRHNGWR